MKEWDRAATHTGNTKVCSTVADLRIRMAEHIIAQNNCSWSDEVLSILAETKVGARRRSALLKELQMVFSVG